MTTLCVNPACSQPHNLDQARVCVGCGKPLWLGDRYRCQALLGQGGFGRTYRAVDERQCPPMPCVVKQMMALDPQRFHREAERLEPLGHHPQIPALLGVIDGAQGQFLVQQYIPGPTLDRAPPDSAKEREALVRRVLAELLPVLDHIHRHGVIHRDIKPANIIVPPAPQPLVLVDFGAAKAIDDLAQRTATVIGSAGYAAPEQALGQAVYASDIFSLGVTCLHLLTGLHPFDLYSVSDDAWVWRPYLAEAVSPALGRVLDRMVNRRLSERYGSAQAVLADLRWGGLGEGRVKPPRSEGMDPGRWEQRFALSLPGGMALGLAIGPTGRAIAAACSDGAVRLWDCTNGEPLHTLRQSLGRLGVGHRGPVNGVVFSADGEAVFSGGEDGQLIRWDVAAGKGQLIPATVWQVSALAIGPHHTLAVGSGDGRILLWPLDGVAEARVLVHHQDRVTALAVERTHRLLVSGGRDRTLRLWSLPSGRLIKTLTAPRAAITALVCHPQDGRIVSGDAEGHVQVWSAEHPDDGLIVHKAAGAVAALALSPNGQWLAMGGDDGNIALMDLHRAAPDLLLSHGWAVQALSFAPDSRLLASSGADETLRFWCLTKA